MHRVVLKYQDSHNQTEVTYLPDQGMNFISFKKNNIEALDTSTISLFEERYAGLGALIGPHFHHRQSIPPVPHPERFPHIARVQKKGVAEPFSHGIGRYAPWTVIDRNQTSLEAVLKGDDLWEGIPLKELEGQNFVMTYKAEVSSKGLHIRLSVESDMPSVVGLHTYYALGQDKGTIYADVQDHYLEGGSLKPIPTSWKEAQSSQLQFPLQESCDYTFYSSPSQEKGTILLKTATHQIKISYEGENQENSWQLWHPKELSFVCIEPLSAHNARQPKLCSSHLEILISIL